MKKMTDAAFLKHYRDIIDEDHRYNWVFRSVPLGDLERMLRLAEKGRELERAAKRAQRRSK